MQKYTFESIKTLLKEEYGYKYISGQYNGVKSKMICKDEDGYYILCDIQKMIYKGTKAKRVHPSNPYSLYNINRYVSINTNNHFSCVSESYTKNNDVMDFRCSRCGTLIQSKWINIVKSNTRNKTNSVGLYCPNCDVRSTESIHALVLKQVWLHEEPDSIVEECSCINPFTNRVMPTDIVNHRLKIAIEVQSWYHDFEDQRRKDKIKSDFWKQKGYSFYAVDQRDYTILEMIQLFFHDIKSIPEYINYNYSNKVNYIKAQKLLDEHMSIIKVSDIMGVKPHRLYDAVLYKSLSYPEGYVNNCYSSVVQFDLNKRYLNVYDSISQAERKTGVCGISNALNHDRNYCGGYYWLRIKDYYSGNYCIKETKLKRRKSE